MTHKPTLLAFDTSAPHCVVAVCSGGEILASEFTEMPRGQAENLFAVIDRVLAKANLSLGYLDGVVVGIGPGNFTGIRISVSAARGLSLGLSMPAVGVSNFEIAHHLSGKPDVIYLTAPRGMLYAQRFANQAPAGDPWVEPAAQDGTQLFKSHDFAWREDGLAALAHHGARKLASHDNHPRPAPLYVRPADAAPARDLPPKILT